MHRVDAAGHALQQTYHTAAVLHAHSPPNGSFVMVYFSSAVPRNLRHMCSLTPLGLWTLDLVTPYMGGVSNDRSDRSALDHNCKPSANHTDWSRRGSSSEILRGVLGCDFVTTNQTFRGRHCQSRPTGRRGARVEKL